MNTSHKHTHLALVLAALTIVFGLAGWLLLGRVVAGAGVAAGAVSNAAAASRTNSAQTPGVDKPEALLTAFNDWRELGHAPAEPDLTPPCNKPQPSRFDVLRCRGIDPVQQPPETAPFKSPAGPRAVAALLYDQTSMPSANGTSEQNFEPAFDNSDSEAADDFVVPAGQTWAVNRVDILGSYMGAPPPAQTTASPVNVTFYTDSPGGGSPNLPGAPIPGCSYTNLTPTATASGGFDTVFTVMLPTSCTLPAGTYWLAFQTQVDFGANSVQHFWNNRDFFAGQVGSEAVFRQPGDGFGTGCTTFMPHMTACVIGTGFDLVFQIHGVNCALAITTTSPLPAGTFGVGYNQTIATSGAMGAVTFTVNSGALPPGVNLNMATGDLTGAPTMVGAFNFEIRATDTTGCFALRTFMLTINRANTTAAITADNPDPSVTGQTVTINYTVTPQGAGTPTGNVTVNASTGESCMATVAAGSCTITFTSAGARTLTATYAGDTNFNASPASAPEPHTVNRANTTTTITADAPDPTVVGQSYTVTAVVAVVAPGAGTPTGTITISDGTNTCTITLPATSCVLPSTSPGAKTLTATYNGDANFNASPASAPEPHTVNRANTTTTITADAPDPTVVGQSYTVTAVVAVVAPGAGTPTGTITVSDGTNTCTITLPGTSCNLPSTTAGAKTLTATYNGDANFNASPPSAGVPHTVNRADTTTTITADNPDPSVINQVVTVNYTVAPVAPGAGTPTGNVTVTASTGESCTGTVAAGSCTIIFNSAGPRTLTAVYAGDANFNGSTSAAVAHNVVIGTLPQNNLTRLFPEDPLLCAGAVVNGSFSQSNPTAFPVTGRVFVTLERLIATPGSVVCTLNPATGGATTFCNIENGMPTWRGTLAAGQRVDITYQGQIPEGVTTNACSTASSQFPDGTGQVLSTAQVCLTINCPGTAGPGVTPDARSIINDQKAGSVLIYNIYTSATNPAQQNTRINITNTSTTAAAFVHLFFVDGSTCAVADNYLCLTANQTASFLASDLDPGTTGYIIAVATDRTGCPIVFNHLIGDEYVKFSTGHAANLGAEAVAAIPGGLTFCDPGSDTALLRFDGVNYNGLPHVVAVDNVPSRLDGNDTLLILNRLGGSLVSGAATLGTVVGILYDDAENALSFVFTAGTCQVRGSISNNFPRTAPRFETFVPSGRSGWLKLYVPPLIGVSGAVINANSQASGFNQGHNLHKLTLTNNTVYTIPVFPPTC